MLNAKVHETGGFVDMFCFILMQDAPWWRGSENLPGRSLVTTEV
jgi:hypothetical protein